MFKTRVITAFLLLLVLIPAVVWLPQTGWAVLTAAVIALGGWEWGRLARFSATVSQAYAAFLFMVLAVFSLLCPPQLLHWPSEETRNAMLLVYGCATILWLLVVPLFLRQRWQISGLGGALLGLVVLVPPWLAIVQFRSLGTGVLLAVLSIAWVADIAAYLSGRAFGRHKLAPSVSPGKTWEGVLGAVCAVMVFGFVVGPWQNIPMWLWGAMLVLLTAVSVLGDLFESLLKRLVNIKDSSQLLPGHGGILDRIDSLTAILPVAACIGLLVS